MARRKRKRREAVTGPPDTVVLMQQLILARARYTTGGPAPSLSWSLRLFILPRTPLPGDAWRNYHECSLPGYAAVDLTPARWLFAAVGGVVNAIYPAVTWDFSDGGQAIYGHLIYDVGNDLLGFVDSYADPVVIPLGGGSHVVALSWDDLQG